MRPIDADAIIKHIEKAYCDGCDNYNYVRCRACGTNDAINVIDEAPTIDVGTEEWISVNDRLPEEKENQISNDFQGVICCCDFGGIPKRIDVRVYGFGRGHFWHGPQIMDGIVTHWMPLPEPPKEVYCELF